MKPLTTSIYTFPDLIRGGYVYVDKTPYVQRLVQEYKGQYFLSRPRRFGKSLLISTLKALFLGQRELFDGLAIADADYDWTTYPVIHLDMASAVAPDLEGTEKALWEMIDEVADENQFELSNALITSRFRELIQKMGENEPVVILIDEYDKPLLGHLGRESVEEVQALLKRFYSVVKITESYQRFVLLTGVSKFSKVSVFSDLNNLTDLTMDRQMATLLGYTQEELEVNFPDYIQRLADHEERTVAQTREDLRDWYNGYRFEENAEPVYNPVSVMKCLHNQKFKNYWFETATPTFLLELMKQQPIDMEDLVVPEMAFSTYEPGRLRPLPLLVQTGYLTIKEAFMTGRRRQYRLGFPNVEIEESFSMWLAEEFCNAPQEELSSALNRLVAALEDGEIDEMLETLKLFFHKIPHTISLDREKYYQTIFFTVFTLIGVMIEAEVNTSIGRIDAVVKTNDGIYVFEFKLHGTAEEAIDQIHEKEYAAPYLDDPRPLTLVGAAFDSKTRNLAEWRTESAG